MKCFNCQKEISDDSKFCEYCGANVCQSGEVVKPQIHDIESSFGEIPQKTEADIKHEKNLDKRIYKWKEKLIDLSKRNRLLSFKFSKYSTLRIIDEQPPEVYRSLVQNSQVMEFLPVKVNDENIAEEDKKSLEELNEGIEFKAQEFKEYEIDDLEKKHLDKFLQTKLSETDLNKALNKISTTAKSTNDDLGYNVLFLALGSIIWYESENSDEKLEAPVLLIPVEIKRKSVGQPYTIKYNEDSVILNPALMLKLKRDFGINLEDINFDEDELNPIEIFAQVQDKIQKQPRWKLLNNIYIGLFSFAKFVMYKDIDSNQDLIKNSDLVKTICGLSEEKQISTNEICPLNELDIKVKPQETYQILDADSSQQQAIQVAKQGHNLVIEGPPGTGKSQTIANIIAELLSQNKKVLFVSQKIAALDVVKNRLDKNGLAPFCLELHSNKTNRKRVIDELVNTLEFSYNGNYSEAALSKLASDIKTLRKCTDDLHTPIGNLSYKPFNAIGFVLDNPSIPDFEYLFENYENWTQEKLNNNVNLFKQMQDILQRLGEPKNFPLYGCEVREIDLEILLKLKNELKNFLKNFNDFCLNINDLKTYLLTKNIVKISQVESLINVAKIVENIPNSAIDNIAQNTPQMAEDIKMICNNIKQFNVYNNRIKNKLNLGILNEDIEFLIQKFSIYRDKFFSRISLKFYKDCKFIRAFLVNNYRPNLDELVNDLNNTKELKTWIEKLEECDSIATDLFDKIWDKNCPNEEGIQKRSKCLLKFKELVNSGKIFDGNILEKFEKEGINYEKIQKSLQNILNLKEQIFNNYNEICELLKFNCERAFGEQFEQVEFAKIDNKFSSILNQCNDLTLWFKYLEILDKIDEANLSEFYKKCFEYKIPLSDFANALKVQFLRIWLNGFVLKNVPSLKQFNSLDQDNLVKEFKILDKNQILSAKTRLVTKLANNINNAKNEYFKEVNILKKYGKLQRFRKALRRMIKDIPHLFLALKPCLMMSPSTVAQLLDSETFKFDVIIFDEASQLTTEDCIGSIIRGDKLIVAGDTKQLPPTSFFQTVVATDDDSEEEDDDDNSVDVGRVDLDSILDECTTSGFPQCMLKWHYRSKHEYLIAFSNKHLYQELYTFPSCIEDSETLGIKFFYHEPSDTTKDNKRLEEAQLVAKAVMQHAKKHPNLSLGVATLNIKQKGLIEAELEKLREEDPSCEDFFSDNNSEYFFIKNLESIQGDERDVIMISIGYFKNQNGTLPMNFGPINKDGGERRLNVLITRARYMVEVFSGIKAADFNMDKTNKRGVQLLQWYLDFAERGEIALKQSTTAPIDDSFDSPFEESVCNALRAKGYSVKSQVGCSGYKIDLAIRDKDNPGHFLLGIECDGARYHSSATARDRDRLRQEVLEQLGWKIYRIWSTDWFKNPQKQLEKLVNYIDSLEAGEDIVSATTEVIK